MSEKTDMTSEAAMETVAGAVRALADAGFVVSGELSFIRPAVAGLVESELTFTRAPVPTLTVRTVKVTTGPGAASPASGYTGDPCTKCGSPRMQRTGACSTCLDCGESGGCG